VKAARKDGTYDLEFTDVDDEDAKTLDVAQAETLAARSKHAHEANNSLAYTRRRTRPRRPPTRSPSW
jgi:hypothetical protein